ncbi:MAG: PD-(D/E)XK nuclease family protein [Candidatus Solibacter usitatus]|nr:PD-(D/E)XK nuclease family protein [Candidatus Solibacter usitatus]
MTLLHSAEAPAPELPSSLFRRQLLAGKDDVCLLTPTATMAEHVRHRLAREGLLVRPDSIVTLSRFVEPLVLDLPAISAAYLDRLIHRILTEDPPEEFQPLAQSKGLRRNLASLVEEVSAAGCDASSLPSASPFRQVLARVEKEAAGAGLHLRSRRLSMAAERLRASGHHWREIYLEGFYAFTPAELEVIGAMSPARVVVSLPEWDGALPSRRALEKLAFRSLSIAKEEPVSRIAVIAATDAQSEAEEISRRVLALSESGTPFRDIAIVVRSETPYVPLLRTTFARFGVPARYYFQANLDTHPTGRFLLGWLRALTSGWDYEQLLPVISSPLSGVPSEQTARIDHWLRERMPGKGLPPELALWQEHSALRAERLTAGEWAPKLAALTSLLRLPTLTDHVPVEQALEWRELFASLIAWQEACVQTAAFLPAGKTMRCADFVAHLAEVLEQTPFSGNDGRRNVVHVMDAFEARQWRLPHVFVCGLTERMFPHYHSEHPILPDADRMDLRLQGVILRTSQERQRDELFLFEGVGKTARQQLTFSYPRINVQGDQTLPSFFLQSFEGKRESETPVRASSKWRKSVPHASAISRASLLSLLKKARSPLSPTAIETYLQCPFQFFARYVLKLNQPPVRPRDRLDALLQGSILHQTLAEGEGSPLFVEEIFSRLFDEACKRESVPSGHLAERVRLEIRANLRRFLESPPLKGASTVAIEKPFDLRLDSHLRVRGKIDRIVKVQQGGLVVIDYKYSRPHRVRELFRSHDRGELVQGGIYLWAAEKLFHAQPAGMLYCGLKGEVSWAGWHLPFFGWHELGETEDAVRLSEIIGEARETSVQVAARIDRGEIAPAPADTVKCDWCAYSTACRIESAPAPLVQVAGGGS